MRYYGFGNYYLSSLQQGLQAAHVIKGLWTEYEKDTESYQLAEEYARNHKTMVLLNGGNAAGLRYIYGEFKRFEAEGMILPFAKFNEDEQSLDGALTAVGIVLTEKYYNMMDFIKRNLSPAQEAYVAKWVEEGRPEWEIELLKNDLIRFNISSPKNEHFIQLLADGWNQWEIDLMKLIIPMQLAK